MRFIQPDRAQFIILCKYRMPTLSSFSRPVVFWASYLRRPCQVVYEEREIEGLGLGLGLALFRARNEVPERLQDTVSCTTNTN